MVKIVLRLVVLRGVDGGVGDVAARVDEDVGHAAGHAQHVWLTRPQVDALPHTPCRRVFTQVLQVDRELSPGDADQLLLGPGRMVVVAPQVAGLCLDLDSLPQIFTETTLFPDSRTERCSLHGIVA